MKKILLVAATVVPWPAFSAEKVFYPAPTCKLFSFSAGKFAAATPSTIPSGTKVDTKPHPKRGDFELFKYNQVSYGAITSCFGAASAETAELPAEVGSESPALAEEVESSSSSSAARQAPSIFLRGTLNFYGMTDGKTDGGSEIDANGVTTTVGELKMKTGLGFLLGFHVTDSGAVIAGYRRLKATQDGTISSANAGGTGSIGTVLEGTFYTVGYQHNLQTSLPIAPYIQGNLVYGKTKENATITGFSGAYNSLNGQVELIESSLGAHFEMGALLPIARNFALTGGLGLTFYSGKKSTVESSSSSVFTSGSTVQGDYGKSHLNIALGAQIQF